MAEEVAPGVSVGQKFMELMVQHAARRGDPALFREIMDRHDGKVSDKVTVKHTGQPPTQRIVVDFDAANDDQADETDGAAGEILGE